MYEHLEDQQQNMHVPVYFGHQAGIVEAPNLGLLQRFKSKLSYLYLTWSMIWESLLRVILWQHGNWYEMEEQRIRASMRIAIYTRSAHQLEA